VLEDLLIGIIDSLLDKRGTLSRREPGAPQRTQQETCVLAAYTRHITALS